MGNPELLKENRQSKGKQEAACQPSEGLSPSVRCRGYMIGRQPIPQPNFGAAKPWPRNRQGVTWQEGLNKGFSPDNAQTVYRIVAVQQSRRKMGMPMAALETFHQRPAVRLARRDLSRALIQTICPNRMP